MPHTTSIQASDFASPRDLSEAFERHAYPSDDGLATACFLSLRMRAAEAVGVTDAEPVLGGWPFHRTLLDSMHWVRRCGISHSKR